METSNTSEHHDSLITKARRMMGKLMEPKPIIPTPSLPGREPTTLEHPHSGFKKEWLDGD